MPLKSQSALTLDKRIDIINAYLTAYLMSLYTIMF